MKKIVIAGISAIGLNNLSDDAMFYALCTGIRKSVKNVQITLLTRHPNKKFDQNYNVHSIKNLDHDSREQSINRYFLGLNRNDKPDNLVEIRKAISECDLFVLDGEPFIDISLGVYRGLLPHAATLIVLAKMYNKPIFVNSIHIGRELKTETGVEYTRFCLMNSDFITTRGENTNEIFKNMGIDKGENIKALSDPAYALDKNDKNIKCSELLEAKRNKKYVIMTTRTLYWIWGESERQRYFKEFADICDWIIEKYNLDIIFVPHNTYSIDKKYMNDIPGHTEIKELATAKQSIHVLDNSLSIQDILGLYSDAELVISNRRHSLIFAALYNVPSVGFGELLHVGATFTELGVNDFFIDIKHWDISIFKEKISNALENREIFQERYSLYLPELQQKANLNFTYLSKYITEK